MSSNNRRAIERTLPLIRAPKASEVLADELRERILDRTYSKGTGLPTERELIEQTGMGRSTVREALRILEVQGLISMRIGRSGGPIAQRPGEDLMAETVTHLARLHNVDLATLLETREALEPHCARLAALYRDENDIHILETLTNAMAGSYLSDEAILEAHVDWHIAVARASKNEMLTGLMVGISHAVRPRVEATLLEASSRESAIQAHEGVLEAIRRQDEQAAFTRMSRHVHAHYTAIKSH